MPIDLDQLVTGGALRGAFAQSLLPVESPLAELTPGQRLGPWAIERKLARGGMSIVYLASRADGAFEQRVALKLMAPAGDVPALEAMFRRERDILASLEHPGIARLLDGGRTADGMLWFAMELIDGEPIDRWCETRGVSRDARLRLVMSLCEALAFAHGRLLVHRDIKPGNVLVDTEGRVRLLDFGIARLADQSDLQGNFALTPGYASPEQLRGEAVGVASDVYQSGLLLALLLGCVRAPAPGQHATATGTGPGALPIDIAAAPTRTLRPDLLAIVRRATASAPTDRYASVEAFRDDLARFLAHKPVTAFGGGVVYRLRCLLRRQTLASAAVVAASLALAGGAVIANLGRIEARRAEAQALRAQRTAQETTDFLLSIFRAPDPRQNPGLDLTARELLDRGIVNAEALADEPQVHANLLAAFGEVTWALGDYTRSRELLERALQMREAQVPRDASSIAALLDRLGGVHRDEARFDAAVDVYRRALLMLAEVDLESSLRAAAVYNNLGIALRRLDRLDEAAEAMERALGIRAASGESPEPSILSNLATIELSRGRYDVAHARFLEAERAMPAELPANHPLRATLYANLAVASRQSGRLGEALRYSKHADAIERAVLGAGHPDRAETLQGMGATLIRLGQYEEAERVIQEGLDLLAASLGEAHPRNLPLCMAHAHAAASNDRHDVARERYLRCNTLIAALPPAQALRPRAVVGRLTAALEYAHGDAEAALAAADAAYTVAREGQHDADAALARLSGALAALALGRRDEAHKRHDEAIVLAACAAGPCRLDQADSRVLRAQWHAALGEREQAYTTLAAAVDSPQWTTRMLDLPGLQALRGDPRWTEIETRLARRIAKDGAAPASPPG